MNVPNINFHTFSVVASAVLACYSRMRKSGQMRLVGHVAHMGEMRNEYKILVGKPEGKRPLARTRHRYYDNIRMDLRKIGCIWLRIGSSDRLL
jgi:hypothetical protein